MVRKLPTQSGYRITYIIIMNESFFKNDVQIVPWFIENMVRSVINILLQIMTVNFLNPYVYMRVQKKNVNSSIAANQGHLNSRNRDKY